MKFVLRISKREKYSRRRIYDDDADINFINERNMKFNKKLERFYGDYTEEIKQNLERGTAVWVWQVVSDIGLVWWSYDPSNACTLEWSWPGLVHHIFLANYLKILLLPYLSRTLTYFSIFIKVCTKSIWYSQRTPMEHLLCVSVWQILKDLKNCVASHQNTSQKE